MSLQHWTDTDTKELAEATTYSELFSIAKRIIERMHQPVGQVCGPITTGGSGSHTDNLRKLEAMIVGLQEHGLELFDQVPFQFQIEKIAAEKGGTNEQELLEGFYLPLFEQRLIQTLYFLPNWESSVGSKWEHEQGARLGLHLVYLQ